MSVPNRPVQGHTPLSSTTGVAYASPVIASMLIIGALAVVQGIYATYFGLPLATIATVILLARIFDAVTDPLIGFCADRYYQRHGSYKPFIIAGAFLLLLGSYFLYIPASESALQSAAAGGEPVVISAGYFLVWYLLLYLGATLFEIPHLAWGRELSPDPQSRVRIYGWRTVALYLGSLLFYALPLMPLIGEGEFTPGALRWVVVLGVVLLLVLLTVSMLTTPNGQGPMPAISHNPSSVSLVCRLRQLTFELSSNRPLLFLIVALVSSLVPIAGMWFTLLFIFVDSYLQLGGEFARASSLSLLVGIAMVPLWAGLSRRWGKQAAVVTSLLIGAAGLAITGLLEPGGSGPVLLLTVMVLCYGMSFTAMSVLVPPLLTDVIDYSRWKFGQDRAATYFSLYMMMNKAAVAGGGALGLAMASAVGFAPGASSHSEEAITGLRWAIAWLPALLVLGSAALFTRLPLNARRQAIVQRRLQVLDRRSSISPGHQNTVSATFLKPDPQPAGSTIA